ncbi:hypothetical protein EB796_010482 [Bugula neritina]|uniref:WSC domain-containing protein n=1 Tax=Bugula neritina TaxID=10212 RepID=A0A7J7K0Y4_BUGNE|nr:hypothetical protein EB796_010482 [Bugula neritina]
MSKCYHQDCNIAKQLTSLSYEFAGLQDSNKCYCGQDPNRYGEALATECNTSCAQNPELTCGGTYRNSVYKTYTNGQ